MSSADIMDRWIARIPRRGLPKYYMPVKGFKVPPSYSGGRGYITGDLQTSGWYNGKYRGNIYDWAGGTGKRAFMGNPYAGVQTRQYGTIKAPMRVFTLISPSYRRFSLVLNLPFSFL